MGFQKVWSICEEVKPVSGLSITATPQTAPPYLRSQLLPTLISQIAGNLLKMHGSES
jgi:hypothetical protein